MLELGLRWRPVHVGPERDAFDRKQELLMQDVADLPPRYLERACEHWPTSSSYYPRAANLIELAKNFQLQETTAKRSDGRASIERAVEEQARRRRYDAVTRAQIEAAADWERQARQEAGMPVPPHQPPLSRKEIDALPKWLASFGVTAGLLVERAGELVEVEL